jgi:hypothetical protein
MPGHSFDYAVVRVVPRVERDEFINAGVIVYCRSLDYLAARIELDRARLAALFALSPDELDEVDRALAVIPRICAGEPDAGPIARLEPAERFHWLVSPRSTITQTSPVHSGLCDDPAKTLDHLISTVVRLQDTRADNPC